MRVIRAMTTFASELKIIDRMNVETTIDELIISFKGKDFILTDVTIEATVLEYAGDSLGHPDDPNPNISVEHDIDIVSVEYYEDEIKKEVTAKYLLYVISKHNDVIESLVNSYSLSV